MYCFNIFINLFTLSATLNVKSGLTTLNNMSGLNFIISLTVLLILDLILKIFSGIFARKNFSYI